MLDRRLGRGPFLMAWAVIAALQVGPVLAGVALEPVLLVGWLVLLQVAKIPIAAMRMVDLGRQPDDAVFGTLIPFANLYVFFGILLGKTPKESRREKLVARWRGQPSWYAAAGPALSLMAKTAVPGLLGVVVLAVPHVLAMVRIEEAVLTWPKTLTAEELAFRFNLAAGLAGLLLLYTALQVAKRKTASATSWWPSVFALPAVLLAGGLYAMVSPAYAGFALVQQIVIGMAFSLAWQALVGGAVAMLWTVAADFAHRGESGGLGAVVARVRERYATVLPAHAGRLHLVWIGQQVVVPGLFYWVYAAFVIPAGTLEDTPSTPLTDRSGALSWGMMSRLVKLCAVYVLLLLGCMAVVPVLHGPEILNSMALGDLSQVPFETRMVVELLGSFALWWVTVVLMLLYRARVAQLEGRRQERAARAAADAEEGADSADAPVV